MWKKKLHVSDFWMVLEVELLCRLFCFHVTIAEDIFKLGCLHVCSEVCVNIGGKADLQMHRTTGFQFSG